MRSTLLISAVAGLALAGCLQADAQNTSASSVATTAPTLYDAALTEVKARVDVQLNTVVDVPVPQDAGGGYTHEQHKRNAKAIYESGILYTATNDAAYADHAAKILTAYADLYSDLPLHPKQKEQSPGRLFWQNLNESWWLVYTIQGYEQIKDELTAEQREKIETGILRPVANFLSEESPETFNKVHNHGTWATAAVGMTGYVLDDEDYVEKALLGLDRSGTGGFLRQLDELFSPDGYYNEGPYYQRYALMPFVLFGQAIEKNEPSREIFEHRDGILKKAIYTTVQQNYGGFFFPINDAIKDKDIATAELLYGVAIAYDLTGDPALLSVAEAQGQVVPTAEGRAVAGALAKGQAITFPYSSMRLRDGAKGNEGALDIFRASDDPDDLAVVIKNTSQGLGHGHFDKMGLLIFDRGREVLRDYGAARFLNIEAKYGGHYLAENNAYAKQTIAHNALVVDGRSHFGGVTEEGNKYAPDLGAFKVSDNLTVTSATTDKAYPGVELSRSVAMVRDPAFSGPILIDLVTADTNRRHDFDLPFHYNGQMVETNFEIKADTTRRSPLGEENGYQYLWQVGEASLDEEALSQVTILLDRRFYTMSTSVPSDTNVIFAELGANDPNFNLRREPAFILRSEDQQNVSFATVFEPHGEYNPTVEYTLDSHSRVKSVDHFKGATADVVQVTTKSDQSIRVGFSKNTDETAEHSVNIDGQAVQWVGPYALFGSDQSN